MDSSFFSVARVRFESTTYTVEEGESFPLRISLLDNITQVLTVQIHTEDDSASDGDYVLDPVLQTITFHPGGSTTELLTVRALEDDYAEPLEGFRVVLSHPSLGLMIIEGNATVYIVDANGMKLSMKFCDLLKSVTTCIDG